MSAASEGAYPGAQGRPQGDGGVAARPRSGFARDAGTAAVVSSARLGQPSGWWGMALFLCSETMLFGGLIASYFYLNFRSSSWPPPGVKPPEVLDPVILTAVLVATSIPMALAARAARAGAGRATVRLLALALVVQCGYLGFQLHSFVSELHQQPPQHSAYSSAYFALLGVHHAHVMLGALLNLGLLFWLLRAGLTNYRVIGVRSIALYWHVVNAIAVAVLLTTLYPSL